MSASNSKAVSGTALIVGIVVCFVAVVGACTAIFLADPTGERATIMATTLLGSLTGTVAALAALYKVTDVDKKVEYLANGGTDAKIRAGIADVVKPDLLKDEAQDQIELDRLHRLAGPAGNGH